MKIGIAGCGMVGGALRRFFETRQGPPLTFDPYKGFTDDLNVCDVLFVCVSAPTNISPISETVNLNAIRSTLNQFRHAKNIFIRSTVLPGTCDSLAGIYQRPVWAMPEFLTERSCDDDVRRMPIITGCPDEELIAKVFPHHKVFHTTNAMAETAKYAHNVHGAMKVTFFNMIYEVVKNFSKDTEADYQKVTDFLCSTGHIDRLYTKVPGPDGQRGYGGGCFPKDVEAFRDFMNDSGFYNAHLFLKVIEALNSQFRSGKV